MINITLAGRDLKYVDLQQLQPERTTTIKAPKQKECHSILE